jgi:hypothetical protein
MFINSRFLVQRMTFFAWVFVSFATFIINENVHSAEGDRLIPNESVRRPVGGGEGNIRVGVLFQDAVPGMDIGRWEERTYPARSSDGEVSFSGSEFVVHGIITAIDSKKITYKVATLGPLTRNGQVFDFIEKTVSLEEIGQWRFGYFAGESRMSSDGRVTRLYVQRSGRTGTSLAFLMFPVQYYQPGLDDDLPAILVSVSVDGHVTISQTARIYRNASGGISTNMSRDPVARSLAPGANNCGRALRSSSL